MSLKSISSRSNKAARNLSTQELGETNVPDEKKVVAPKVEPQSAGTKPVTDGVKIGKAVEGKATEKTDVKVELNATETAKAIEATDVKVELNATEPAKANASGNDNVKKTGGVSSALINAGIGKADAEEIKVLIESANKNSAINNEVLKQLATKMHSCLRNLSDDTKRNAIGLVYEELKPVCQKAFAELIDQAFRAKDEKSKAEVEIQKPDERDNAVNNAGAGGGTPDLAEVSKKAAMKGVSGAESAINALAAVATMAGAGVAGALYGGIKAGVKKLAPLVSSAKEVKEKEIKFASTSGAEAAIFDDFNQAVQKVKDAATPLMLNPENDVAIKHQNIADYSSALDELNVIVGKSKEANEAILADAKMGTNKVGVTELKMEHMNTTLNELQAEYGKVPYSAVLSNLKQSQNKAEGKSIQDLIEVESEKDPTFAEKLRASIVDSNEFMKAMIEIIQNFINKIKSVLKPSLEADEAPLKDLNNTTKMTP